MPFEHDVIKFFEFTILTSIPDIPTSKIINGPNIANFDLYEMNADKLGQY
jgi:hypothetical protein